MNRALVIEASGELWGSERALLDLLGAASNLELAVCCPPNKPLNKELSRRRIRVLPYYVYGLHRKSRVSRLRAAAGVLRACVEFHPDVIYLNQSGCYKVALLAATMLDLPIVAHVRIFEDAAYLAVQKPTPHRLRAIIAISSAIEAEIRRFGQLDSIRLHRVYDGYSRSDCLLETNTRERVVNRIACVGRVVPIKGQDILIKALCLLSQSGQSGECLFLGNGDEWFVNELKQRVSSEGSSFSIQWRGFVADVFPTLTTCSLLVCASHREPLGRVIFEAWDAGLVPIVFAGSGGAAEIVTAAKGGILYDAQTPESLASALREALDLNANLRNQLVGNGRDWMLQNCDSQKYGAEMSGILASGG